MANIGSEGFERLPDLMRLKAEISGAIESKCAEIEKRLAESIASASGPAYQMSAQDVRMQCVSLVAKHLTNFSPDEVVAAADKLAAFVMDGKDATPEKSNG
jgi:hypothetical protein